MEAAVSASGISLPAVQSERNLIESRLGGRHHLDLDEIRHSLPVSRVQLGRLSFWRGYCPIR